MKFCIHVPTFDSAVAKKRIRNRGTRAPPGPCRACAGGAVRSWWCSSVARDRPAGQPTRERRRRTGPARAGATVGATDTVGPWSTRSCPRRSSPPSTGSDDWRYLLGAIHATFHAGSYPAAAQLVVAFTEAAERAVHHPDIDVRYPGRVHVVLTTHATGGLTTLDADLAREFSRIAAAAGAAAEPHGAQQFELALDTMDADAIRPFWAAVLGYREVGGNLVDPLRIGPPMWFQQMDEPRTERGRFHIDVTVAARRGRAAHRGGAGGRRHGWSPTATPARGGCSPTPTATRRASAPGRTATDRSPRGQPLMRSASIASWSARPLSSTVVRHVSLPAAPGRRGSCRRGRSDAMSSTISVRDERGRLLLLALQVELLHAGGDAPPSPCGRRRRSGS